MTGLQVTLAPLLPPWALLVLAAAAALICLLGIIWRARGSWLRLCFSLVMLALLANPAVVREQREPLKDLAIVMVDRSPSQEIGERRSQTDAALAELEGKVGVVLGTARRSVGSK